MPVITLTSDFGIVDYRVAAIKGCIVSQKPDACIIDITHDIEAHNLLQTAYIVRNAYHYFPKDSIHIICVDSFYRKEIRPILYKVDGHYFIASDNGILSLIFKDINPESVYEITLNNRFDDEVNSTVRDIFVPTAVYLLSGGSPEVIGRPIKDPQQKSYSNAVYNESEKIIIGEAIYIDHFGNVVSNISRSLFLKTEVKHTAFKIRFRNYAFSTVHNNHTDLVKDWSRESEYHGKSAAVFNEAELLEICIYKGNKNNGAKSLLGINIGEKIYVEFS
ncbi:SAM hydrolase/SAM-dependent halogenase family protein [Bergeyella sp. RCAD1439]|uniref:SAM hydrolase/SAM-dependent halogenase family protein n=1 Tax=Bergeyella anatis TaxID=3113737 RepID=UPI002E170D05|nr:SAM-dependent chlorinase/fluorinase [Bergeyella sp. RCAD1439]